MSKKSRRRGQKGDESFVSWSSCLRQAHEQSSNRLWCQYKHKPCQITPQHTPTHTLSPSSVNSLTLKWNALSSLSCLYLGHSFALLLLFIMFVAGSSGFSRPVCRSVLWPKREGGGSFIWMAGPCKHTRTYTDVHAQLFHNTTQPLDRKAAF